MVINMKILITGGAGFIGSHIADSLLEEGHRVVVIDNLSTGNLENIKHLFLNPKFKFVNGDITNIDTCRTVCEDIDKICHQAALGSVPRSINDPLSSHNNNVNGFLNILIVAKENNIKRVVYASSSSVYGDSDILPKQEDNIGNQLSPYAVTKYVNELYANVFTKSYGLECIGLRYFNVFGPRQNPNGEYAAVIPKFINLMKNKQSPIIYGTTHTRDFTYVANVVNANKLALFTDNKNCFGDIFNIGTGGNIGINELFNKINDILHLNIKYIQAQERSGDILHSFANISKAKEYLLYDPICDFDTGLKITIDSIKNE